MNNYINVRVQGHNNKKLINTIKHNLRAISSLNKDLNTNNSNYIMLDNKLIKLDKTNIKHIYKQLHTLYQNDRSEHNEIYKKHNKRNLRENNGSWFEGVFTFSEQMKKDLKDKKYTMNDLVKVANDCLKEIASTYGAEIKYMTLHLDETSPHFHWSLNNFNDRGLSLYNQNKNKDFLSNLQNIGFKHFSSLGMERGISKEINSVNHKEINKYWRDKNIVMKQENKELNNVNLSLKNMNKKEENNLNELQKLSFTLKSEITSLNNDINDNKIKINDLKIERETISKDNTKSKEEKKILYSEITLKQKELRELNEDIKEVIKSKKEVSNDLNNDINYIVEQSVTFNKFVNVEKLQQHIRKILLKYLKLNTQLNELKEKDRRIKELENVVEKGDVYIQKLEKKVVAADELDKIKSDEIKKYQQRDKEEKSFTNNEIKIIGQKYENELKEKNLTIKQQTQQIDTLKDKVSDYEDYIINNNLSEDFKQRNTKKQIHRH